MQPRQTMSRIALKIDVDTLRGALVGVPRLVDLLRKHEAQATFFVSLGPDQTGRAIGLAMQRHRLGHYGIKTLMHGTLLPGPDIGRACRTILAATRDAGFEVGVRAWRSAAWSRHVERARSDWTEREMKRAIDRFTDIFGEAPHAHGAADWQTNIHALRLTQRLGFAYASDCRGTHPFVPMINGEIMLCPQIPTTLPTLEELLAIAGTDEASALRRLLERTQAPGNHVFALQAELEGMKWLPTLDRLLGQWRGQGHSLIALNDIANALNIAALPRHEILRGEITGRADMLTTQGPEFLSDWREAA